MKIPGPKQISLSPILWKESIASDSTCQTIDSYCTFLREHLRKQHLKHKDWLNGIAVEVSNSRIKKLVNGYAILDVLDWDGQIQLLHTKMWRLFEDLVGEVLRETLRDRPECTVVHVDRLKGFPGLDFVIANSQKRDVWTVGIQCKRYIGSSLSKTRVEECGSYTKGTSAVKLAEKGKKLHERFPKKKFILTAFNAFRRNERQRQRFTKLKDAWDCVMVFDKSKDTQTPYTYRISLPELSKIEKWA